MLLKKSVFLLPCAFYSAVTAAPVASNGTIFPELTGQHLELFKQMSKPFGENEVARSYHKDNTTLSGYEQDGDVQAAFINCSPDWLKEGWDVTFKIWEKWGNSDKSNAKTCINYMIRTIEARCGSNTYDAKSGQCYCGAFMGDKVNGPGVAQGLLEDTKSQIDQDGIGKNGYTGHANFNDRDRRFGIAINCNGNQAWVAQTIATFSANQVPGGESQSKITKFYGAINKMTT